MKELRRIIRGRKLPGPLQGQEQGRTRLRQLAKDPQELVVPPEQDQAED
jgi:hypothetical protein